MTTSVVILGADVAGVTTAAEFANGTLIGQE